MSKTGCGSCSTTEASFTVALGAAGLAFDPLARAVVPKTALLLLVATIALALAVPQIVRRAGAGWSKPMLLWLCAAGWVTASLAWSDVRGATTPAVMVAMVGLSVGLSGLRVDVVKRLASRVAMLVGAGSTLIAIGMRFGGATPHGGHGNPNWFGLVVVAAVPLMVDRVARVRGLERWIGALALALAIVGLAWSGSRSAWLGGWIALAFSLSGRRRWAVLGAGLVLCGVAVWQTDVGAAWAGRVWIWKSAVAAWRAAPIVGHGAGGFAAAFLDAQGVALQGQSLDVAAVRFVNAQSAHHDGLHMLVEGGPIAVALLALAFVTGIRSHTEGWRGGAAMLVAVAVAGLGDVALLQPAVTILVALVLAACRRTRARRWDGVAAVALLATLGLSLPQACRVWFAERRITQALASPLDERVALLEQASAVAPSSGHAELELGLTHLALGQPAPAVVALTQSRRTWANVGTDVALGNAYLGMGDTGAAVRAFRRALRRQPARFAAHANFAEALRRSGDLALAEQHLRSAEELQPHHPKLSGLRERLRRSAIDSATSDALRSPSP